MELTSFLYPLGLTLGFTGITATVCYHVLLKKHLASSTVLYSLLIFCIVYFVSFENNIGLGIGLLGILSLIRLRTTLGNLTDTGFAFYSITIGLLNASINDLTTILIVDIVLTFMIILLSTRLIFPRNIVTSTVIFDDLDFTHLDDQKYLKERLHKDLKIKPMRVSVEKVDYLKDSVTVKVTYEMH